MFRSRLGAIVFVGLIIFSVYRMVGTQEAGGDLVSAVAQIESNSSGTPAQQPRPASSAPRSQSADAMTFDQWIDEAEVDPDFEPKGK